MKDLNHQRQPFNPFITKALLCGCTSAHLCPEARRLSDRASDAASFPASRKLAAHDLARHRKGVNKGYRMALNIIEANAFRRVQEGEVTHG